MKKHADSQVDDAETTRLLTAAMRAGDAGSLRLVQARTLSTAEMIGHWAMQTPEGPLHRVAVVRMIDGEQAGFDHSYRDEADAAAVWGHLTAEAAG